MSDSSDDMEFYSGYLDDDDSDYDDMILKRHMVLTYCEPHLDKMWAAKIVGILLGCDFRDSKDHLEMYFHWAEQEGIQGDNE